MPSQYSQDLNDRLPIRASIEYPGYLCRRQPYYDFEFAKISAWLKTYEYRCHVSLKGEVVLKKKGV